MEKPVNAQSFQSVVGDFIYNVVKYRPDICIKAISFGKRVDKLTEDHSD